MSIYTDCTVCGASPSVCEDTDGGCCSGCRATGGCSHGPTPTPQARPSARDVERVLAEVSLQHQRIPLYGTGPGRNRCSGCNHLLGTTDGPNSPRHVAHVAAEQAAALRALPTGDEEVSRLAEAFKTGWHRADELGLPDRTHYGVRGVLAALTTPPAQDPSKETDR